MWQNRNTMYAAFSVFVILMAVFHDFRRPHGRRHAAAANIRTTDTIAGILTTRTQKQITAKLSVNY